MLEKGWWWCYSADDGPSDRSVQTKSSPAETCTREVALTELERSRDGGDLGNEALTLWTILFPVSMRLLDVPTDDGMRSVFGKKKKFTQSENVYGRELNYLTNIKNFTHHSRVI